MENHRIFGKKVTKIFPQMGVKNGDLRLKKTQALGGFSSLQPHMLVYPSAIFLQLRLAKEGSHLQLIDKPSAPEMNECSLKRNHLKRKLQLPTIHFSK